MTEVDRILDQMKRAFSGDAWHGEAIGELLAGITAQQAAARPIENAHSIREIVLHITAWERAVRRRLGGERAELAAEENWPSVAGTDAQSWEREQVTLSEVHEELRRAVAQLADAQLDEPILPGMSSVYVTLHGIIQHSLYHAGQIAILRKAFAEDEPR
jgi:uncharacterized damage-inducible protein DinB